MHLSYALFLSIFGKDFTNLLPSDIIYKQGNTIVACIASIRHMKQLLTVFNYCLIEHESYSQVCTCGGKIKLVDPEEKHTNGFVTNETEHNCIILTHTSLEILLCKGNYSSFVPVYIQSAIQHVQNNCTKLENMYTRQNKLKNLKNVVQDEWL